MVYLYQSLAVTLALFAVLGIMFKDYKRKQTALHFHLLWLAYMAVIVSGLNTSFQIVKALLY
jgi:hypothetical protein